MHCYIYPYSLSRSLPVLAITFIHECLVVKKVPDLQTCLDMLLDHCLEKGSNDNMTAAIIALPGFCRVHNYFKKPSTGICNVS